MRRYYEFAVVVVIVGILGIFVTWALERARKDMEEAGMQMEVAAIRAQLMEVAVHRETFGGRLPASDNPMDWISDLPPNYRGGGLPVEEERGIWYFDKSAGELVFRFQDGHLARFRLSREAGRADGRGVPVGIGLLRLSDGLQ